MTDLGNNLELGYNEAVLFRGRGPGIHIPCTWSTVLTPPTVPSKALTPAKTLTMVNSL